MIIEAEDCRRPSSESIIDGEEEEVEEEEGGGNDKGSGSGILSNPTMLRDDLVAAMEGLGLTVLNSVVVVGDSRGDGGNVDGDGGDNVYDDDNEDDIVVVEGGTMVALILREGYVAARPYPTRSYCALDVHLWGGGGGSFIDLHDDVRDAALRVLGSGGRGGGGGDGSGASAADGGKGGINSSY